MGGGVQAALAGENHAVQGDAVAGQDAQHVAHLSLPGRNHGALFQGDHFRPQVHGFHDLAAAPGHGLSSKIFADAVEQHNADGFREAAHGEGAQGGNAHQEVLVQHMALEQVAAGGFQHRQAQHKIPGHEGNIGGDGQIQPFQEQAHHEETRAGEDGDEVRILFLLLGGWLGLGFQGVISASGSSSRATARMAGIRASGFSAVRRSCSVAKVMVASSTRGCR